jgi:hypothetical protein
LGGPHRPSGVKQIKKIIERPAAPVVRAGETSSFKEPQKPQHENSEIFRTLENKAKTKKYKTPLASALGTHLIEGRVYVLLVCGGKCL